MSNNKQKDIRKRILVTGPESSGKSTLARQLAWALDGIYVPEFARSYLQQTSGYYTEEDLVRIWQGQLSAEQCAPQLLEGALLVCDTGPYVLHVWSEVKYGRIAPVIVQAVETANYDLVLLCKPDLPWQADPLREHPSQADRTHLFGRYVQLLDTQQQPYKIIAGNHRIEQAMRFSLGARVNLRSPV